MRKTSRKKSISAEVVCPMYKGEEIKKVCCEGFADGIFIQTYFSGQKQKMQYKAEFCENLKCFTACPIYQLAAKRFEEE